jgi:hypothetical protein
LFEVARVGFGGVFGGWLDVFKKTYTFISISYWSYSNKTFAPSKFKGARPLRSCPLEFFFDHHSAQLFPMVTVLHGHFLVQKDMIPV